MADNVATYHHGIIYHLEDKQIFPRFKIYFFFRWFVFNMVYVDFFGGKNSVGYLLKILVKKVVRGNAVQIFSSFPAKRLSI